METRRIITSSFVKNTFIALAVFAVGQCVFAVTGKRLASGDDKAKKTESTVGFSNLKSKVTFSLKDSYSIPSRNNSFGYKTSQQIKTASEIVSIKKGNITYVVPFKAQAGVKLPAFIKAAPTQSTPR